MLPLRLPSVSHPGTAAETPPEFIRALHSLRGQRLRAEVHLAEVPAPARIAPYSVALSGEVLATSPTPQGGTDDELASGRFVALHDPHGQEAWEGTFRIVSFVRATLDAEMAGDPLLAQVAWSWFTDALQDAAVTAHALGGTVTRVLSQGFESLAERTDDVEIEIRASWTPPDGDLGPHLLAWAALLCATGGLPPLPDGVTALSARR